MQPTIKSKNVFKRTVFKSLFFVIIILIVGTYISYVAEVEKQQQQNAVVMQTLQNDLAKIKSNFNERITFYMYGLKGLNGLISTVGLAQFDYRTMLSYAQNRNFQQEFAGVRGIGFIQKVKQEALADFINQQKLMRPDNHFKLRQLSTHNDSLFIIRYIEPEKFNQSAVGLDIGSETMRRNAAINSALNNSIQFTAPITLVQAGNKAQQGFLILLPLYDTSDIPSIPQDRLNHLLGWSYAPILIDEVLNANHTFPQGVDVSISDVTNNNRVIFYQPELVQAPEGAVTYVENANVFGRVWELTAVASSQYIEQTRTVKPYAIFTQYMILTGLLALGVWSFILFFARKAESRNHQQQLLIAKDEMLERSNAQLENLVQQRTKEINSVNALQTAILQNANHSIIATNTAGLITLFNPAAERLTGYAASELILKKTPAILHLWSELKWRAKELSAELKCEIKPGPDTFFAKSARGLVDTNTWTYVNKEGQHIPVMLTITALTDSNNEITGYLGISYDLTDQIEREKALAEAKDLAEKANIAKSEFLANMSHEIRTPLNGIYGTLQLLQNETAEDKKEQLLKLATGSTLTLNRLVNDILDFSKLEAGKLELDYTAVNLVDLLAVVESELTASIRQQGLTFKTSIELQHAVWKVDELRLKQILLNMLSNAIKFTEKGHVSLSIEEHKSRGIVIHIKDSGIGMSDEAQALLFERFEQADKSITRRYGGTGLGMSITHWLVNLMEGEIEVFSQENVGTEVRVFLPLEMVTSSEIAVQPEVVPIDSLADKAILVAEDNEINQLVLSSMLEKSDVTIYLVDNGQLAVDFVETSDVDIILMDIQMPVMGGVEACKLIKAEQPNLPIIAITANAFKQDIALYKEAGFDGFITKPFAQEHLLKTIANTLKTKH
ncbi:CHASE domain-containing protein [Paraglaciecola aquimarina]|uniref:histidine kinase n=1 Tax=Paraglaciecola aquimarina TaxID=1235557 RepID=A0ABU3SUY8_9ALTE|nr:CHASE domain-containing protein [Paraglaciecola aquimarina]MDU0353807.1 CHASE domain-containing protein [Paraglaciecola aquimarina]